VRNGFLLAAIAVVLALAALTAQASADTGRIALGPLVVHNPAELDVPYTLDALQPRVAKLGIAIKIPNEPDFEFLGYYDPQPSGSIHVFWKRFDGGEVRMRITAVGEDGSVLDTAEAVTTVERWTLMQTLTPYFGKQEVGVTERRSIRIEAADLPPLRIRGVKVSGNDFKFVSEDCTGRLVSLEGCYIDIEFTPTAVGERRGLVELEANAPTSGLELRGIGVVTPSEPLLPRDVIAQATPTPTPTPTVAEPPELVFNSEPGRTSTRLFGLRVEHVEPGTTITVRCAKGCPVKSLTKRGVRGTVSLSRFASRRLKVGTTIRVTIAEPGARPIETTLKVRAKREPSVVTRVKTA
jgi:hypothetical protein